jgi:hypothetical protein
VVEQFPKLEGRQMIMMIAPGRKKPAGKAANEAAPAACRVEFEGFLWEPDNERCQNRKQQDTSVNC